MSPPCPSRHGSGSTVLIADDHPLYREGVVRALSASGRVEIVAEAEDGRDALAKIHEHLPDVALLDYKLPELDGVAVTTPSRASSFRSGCCSSRPSWTVASSTRRSRPVPLASSRRRRAGSRSSMPCWPVPAVRTSCRRTSPRASLSEIRLRKNDDAPALTPREQEILHLIAAGKSLPDIAKELYLGLTTVKTHVQHLYEKLGVSDRAAAVATAMRRGLIE